MILTQVLGCFVAGRAYSYVVDGPPDNRHAECMTLAEAAGAAVASGTLVNSVAVSIRETPVQEGYQRQNITY